MNARRASPTRSTGHGCGTSLFCVHCSIEDGRRRAYLHTHRAAENENCPFSGQRGGASHPRQACLHPSNAGLPQSVDPTNANRSAGLGAPGFTKPENTLRLIILLALAAFLAALWVDAYVLRPGAAPQSSPYALAPSDVSIETEGRAAYVDPAAQPAAPGAFAATPVKASLSPSR